MAPDEAVAHQSNNGFATANPFAVAPHFSQPPELKGQHKRGGCTMMHALCIIHVTHNSQRCSTCWGSTVGPTAE